MRRFLIATTLVLGAAASPALASETYSGSAGLDQIEATYTPHTREHREWEIQRNMERQHYGRGRGYGHGRGYGRGYGPPPHARGYGYGRPDRGYYRY